MAILIGKYEFDGPYRDVTELEEKQGLLAVLHYEDGEYELIYLRQSKSVSLNIEISQSANRSFSGIVLFAVCYTPHFDKRQRIKMVEEIQHEIDQSEGSLCC